MLLNQKEEAKIDFCHNLNFNDDFKMYFCIKFIFF